VITRGVPVRFRQCIKESQQQVKKTKRGLSIFDVEIFNQKAEGLPIFNKNDLGGDLK